MKALVVEEEFVSRNLMVSILENHFAICHVAINGREALYAFKNACLEKKPYDLVCLEIMMSEMDGHEVLREIRKLEHENGIGGKELAKVIMVTRCRDPINIMKAFVDGACDAYLGKPLDHDKLKEKLREFGLAG